MSVLSWLSEDQDKLNVIFDDRIRLKWLAQEIRRSSHLGLAVRDLVPNDWGKVVEANLNALLNDIGV